MSVANSSVETLAAARPVSAACPVPVGPCCAFFPCCAPYTSCVPCSCSMPCLCFVTCLNFVPCLYLVPCACCMPYSYSRFLPALTVAVAADARAPLVLTYFPSVTISVSARQTFLKSTLRNGVSAAMTPLVGSRRGAGSIQPCSLYQTRLLHHIKG